MLMYLINSPGNKINHEDTFTQQIDQEPFNHHTQTPSVAIGGYATLQKRLCSAPVILDLNPLHSNLPQDHTADFHPGAQIDMVVPLLTMVRDNLTVHEVAAVHAQLQGDNHGNSNLPKHLRKWFMEISSLSHRLTSHHHATEATSTSSSTTCTSCPREQWMAFSPVNYRCPTHKGLGLQSA